MGAGAARPVGTNHPVERGVLNDAGRDFGHNDLALSFHLAILAGGGRTTHRPGQEAAQDQTKTKDEEFTRIRIDMLVGMAFSNIIAIAIIITTAATLHANGKTNIATSAQAVEALRPLAGAAAELIFALGIIGTGLLAIPVLAGSTAYAIGEGRKWPVGLSRKPERAIAFYSVLAFCVLIGIGVNFTALDPIKALYWSAVVNGVLAPPVMVLLMLLVRRKKVMGDLQVEGWLYWLGWLATTAMALSIVGMAFSIGFGQN